MYTGSEAGGRTPGFEVRGPGARGPGPFLNIYGFMPAGCSHAGQTRTRREESSPLVLYIRAGPRPRAPGPGGILVASERCAWRLALRKWWSRSWVWAPRWTMSSKRLLEHGCLPALRHPIPIGNARAPQTASSDVQSRSLRGAPSELYFYEFEVPSDNILSKPADRETYRQTETDI